MNFSIFTVFLKNRNIIFKMKISKVTDYAALTGDRAQGDDSKHDSHYSPMFTVVALGPVTC